jgi:GT2 family glycosyltransferase
MIRSRQHQKNTGYNELSNTEESFFMNRMEKKVSIIIVTYNALDYVKKCLESVLANTDPMHEIIVVDNHSAAPTRQYVQSLRNYPNVKLILNKENRLWSPANNQGLKASASDAKFCLLLNSDVEVFSPSWLRELQHPMHQF